MQVRPIGLSGALRGCLPCSRTQTYKITTRDAVRGADACPMEKVTPTGSFTHKVVGTNITYSPQYLVGRKLCQPLVIGT